MPMKSIHTTRPLRTHGRLAQVYGQLAAQGRRLTAQVRGPLAAQAVGRPTRVRGRLTTRVSGRLAAQDGFTMLLALGVMLVCSLLVAAAFDAANGDIDLSHRDSLQKQAYYAALAGVQEFEYHLQANPDYWQTCSSPANTVPQEANEHYEIKLLVASTAPEGTKACSTSSPFASMIQSSGSNANTFRIESIGTAGKAGTSSYATRSIVATFHVVGFLNFIYFTQYEDGDPNLYGGPTTCENYYPKRVSLKVENECVTIVFADGDTVEGPMHTDDATDICGKAYFGRKGHNPPDTIQMNYGVYSTCGGSEGVFYNSNGKEPTVGPELLTPEGDTSLGTYVKEGGEEFVGSTHIVLNGAENTMTVTNSKNETKVELWPENGLVYVRASTSSTEPCNYTFKDSPTETDDATEVEKETHCGDVYVKGTYSKPLTIAAEENVTINGNIYPTSVAGKLGTEPSGTATLGLIAGRYVRIYHPLTGPVSSNDCSKASNGEGSLENPWIYAAILSTNHSFAVDNYECGKGLGELNVYGAIAQRFRGIVGIVGGSGYVKDYKYDERLAVDEPPYFLNPINAGWEVSRETAPGGG
jgi:Tfp pilus assembly protein PilE